MLMVDGFYRNATLCRVRAKSLLILSLVGTLVPALFVAAWIWLPRFAPLFVIQYSPWIEPVLRADKFACEQIPGYHRNPLWGRLDGWGSGCVPGLIRCLSSNDVSIRQSAADSFEGLIYDQRAIEPLRATLHDPNKFVRTTALNALSKQGLDRPDKDSWLRTMFLSVERDPTLQGDVRTTARSWLSANAVTFR
jgi:hypothetical protein